MNDNRNIHIVVRPVVGQEGAYQASYVSEFLQAEFCVTVKDSIFGALALQAFSEMIRKAFGKHYRSGQINFEMSQALGSPHSRTMLDVVEYSFCA